MVISNVFPTKEQVAIETGKYLCDLFIRYSHSEILFLVSGGSCLEVLNYMDIGDIPSNLTLGLVDERFSFDSRASNSLQLQDTQYAHIHSMQAGGMLLAVPHPGDTLYTASKRYANALSTWKQKNPKGKIVCLMGIGTDGHTAGIMPYPENKEYFQQTFVNTKHWVIGYDAGNKNKYPFRITITMPFLQFTNALIFYACGTEKKDVIRSALSLQTQLHEIPASVMNQISPSILFTDVVMQ